jgi:hypothetical protein
MSSNRPSTADTNTELHKLEETAASTAASSPDDELNYASTPDPSFQVPQHLRNGLITRHVVMQWDNSMDGLASAPQNATWRPLEDAYHIFQSRSRYAPNCRRATERQGDLGNVILMGMRIKRVESTFPCQLGLTVAGASGNYYTCNGERYSYAISAGESSPTLNTVIATTNPFVNSQYLQTYPGMTAAKLRSEGIMEVPGENYQFVDKQHPIVEMMQENADTLQINLADAQLVDGRWYKVSKAVTERCLSELETELVSNLPIVDLRDFNATVSRFYGRDWDDADEVCDNVSKAATRSRLMAQDRRLTVVLQMQYCFM